MENQNWTDVVAQALGLDGATVLPTREQAASAIVTPMLANYWLDQGVPVEGLVTRSHVATVVPANGRPTAVVLVAPRGRTEDAEGVIIGSDGEVIKQMSQEMVDVQLYGAQMAHVLHHGVESLEAVLAEREN